MALREDDLVRREARIAAIEARLRRRARDLACRQAELSTEPDHDSTAAALQRLLHERTSAARGRVTSTVQIAVAVWLMVAPAAVGYSKSDPRGASFVCGAALALLGMCRLSGAGGVGPWADWLSAAAATALLAVASLADTGRVAMLNDAAVGVAVWTALAVRWARMPGRT
jgi:hypothetical protein